MCHEKGRRLLVACHIGVQKNKVQLVLPKCLVVALDDDYDFRLALAVQCIDLAEDITLRCQLALPAR